MKGENNVNESKADELLVICREVIENEHLFNLKKAKVNNEEGTSVYFSIYSEADLSVATYETCLRTFESTLIETLREDFDFTKSTTVYSSENRFTVRYWISEITYKAIARELIEKIEENIQHARDNNIRPYIENIVLLSSKVNNKAGTSAYISINIDETKLVPLHSSRSDTPQFLELNKIETHLFKDLFEQYNFIISNKIHTNYDNPNVTIQYWFSNIERLQGTRNPDISFTTSSLLMTVKAVTESPVEETYLRLPISEDRDKNPLFYKYGPEYPKLNTRNFIYSNELRDTFNTVMLDSDIHKEWLYGVLEENYNLTPKEVDSLLNDYMHDRWTCFSHINRYLEFYRFTYFQFWSELEQEWVHHDLLEDLYMLYKAKDHPNLIKIIEDHLSFARDFFVVFKVISEEPFVPTRYYSSVRSKLTHYLKDPRYIVYPLDQTYIRNILSEISEKLDLIWDEGRKEWMEEPTFTVNQYLELKLENGRTNIYVDGEKFRQCKYLILNLPKSDPKISEVDSIDEAEQYYSLEREGNRDTVQISPREEFKAHCSNLHAWFKYDYNTKILHRRLAFPLLDELSKAGDPLAEKALKEDVISRLESGYPNVVQYLINKYELLNVTVDVEEYILPPEKMFDLYTQWPVETQKNTFFIFFTYLYDRYHSYKTNCFIKEWNKENLNKLKPVIDERFEPEVLSFLNEKERKYAFPLFDELAFHAPIYDLFSYLYLRTDGPLSISLPAKAVYDILPWDRPIYVKHLSSIGGKQEEGRGKKILNTYMRLSKKCIERDIKQGNTTFIDIHLKNETLRIEGGAFHTIFETLFYSSLLRDIYVKLNKRMDDFGRPHYRLNLASLKQRLVLSFELDPFHSSTHSLLDKKEIQMEKISAMKQQNLDKFLKNKKKRKEREYKNDKYTT